MPQSNEEKIAVVRAWQRAHPDLHRAAGKRYRELHPDRVRAQIKRWKRANPDMLKAQKVRRKQLERQGTVVDTDALYLRDGKRCQICKKPMDRSEVTLDHIIPLSLGGTHQDSNVQIAHHRCNSSRGAGRIPAQMKMG